MEKDVILVEAPKSEFFRRLGASDHFYVVYAYITRLSFLLPLEFAVVEISHSSSDLYIFKQLFLSFVLAIS